MPKAKSKATTQTPTRRSLFALAGATTAAAAMPGAANSAPSVDAKLIELCRRYVANEAERDRLSEPYLDLVGGEPPEVTAAIQRLSDEVWDLRRRIIRIPARTPQGIRAKAEVVRSHWGDDCPPDAWEAWSLVHDILGIPFDAA
jgi:hypothetical protein